MFRAKVVVNDRWSFQTGSRMTSFIIPYNLFNRTEDGNINSVTVKPDVDFPGILMTSREFTNIHDLISRTSCYRSVQLPADLAWHCQ